MQVLADLQQAVVGVGAARFGSSGLHTFEGPLQRDKLSHRTVTLSSCGKSTRERKELDLVARYKGASAAAPPSVVRARSSAAPSSAQHTRSPSRAARDPSSQHARPALGKHYFAHRTIFNASIQEILLVGLGGVVWLAEASAHAWRRPASTCARRAYTGALFLARRLGVPSPRAGAPGVLARRRRQPSRTLAWSLARATPSCAGGMTDGGVAAGALWGEERDGRERS
ncbi:hypothetical protein GUJ93_ZPchr0009g921 [Zizania palustris]|uniref:Uncharacterized protein n=1 Tax=Zizania palustris TaxID=103762 RepID=A0A8J5V4L8_ZIZPA|nr:hypothetical protein GUJ93_ZPchr0009g921 [Zizania palustris]